MISSKYNIKDPEVKRAIDEIERLLIEATAGRDKGRVTQSDIAGVSEKSVTVDEQNKRLVVRIGGKLYATDVDEVVS